MKITLLTTLDASSLLVQALRATGHIDSLISTREAADALCDATVVMINWPHILRQYFIDCQHIVLNVHNSLLPRYRGRHAFTWAILNGERELGFSLHVVTPEIDAGDVLATVCFPLGDDEDVMVAFQRGEETLLAWLPKVLDMWMRGELSRLPQDASQATYFRKRNDEDNWLPSFHNAATVRNLVRAVAPPYTAGAKFRTANGTTLRVAGAVIAGEVPAGVLPGTVLARAGDEIVVACGDHTLRLAIANANALSNLQAGHRLAAGAP